MQVQHFSALVMAAGQGTRMKSRTPKVLHEAAGRPLVYYPVHAALGAGAREVVVVVSPALEGAVREALAVHLPEAPLSFAVQSEPKGTGDAVSVGLRALVPVADPQSSVLILSGDTPLLEAEGLRPLLAELGPDLTLRLATFSPPNPRGYGRVLRDPKGCIVAIREERDLISKEERALTEVNAGIYFVRRGPLGAALGRLEPNNAQGEYYLTDVVADLASGGSGIDVCELDVEAVSGVNDRHELNKVEALLFERIRERHARAGNTFIGAPCIDDTVILHGDVLVEQGVRLRGRTILERGARVDVGVVIEDATIGEQAYIKPYSVIVDSQIGSGAQIGPFAHLRPESSIGPDAHIGNFVETKKTIIHKGAKANHLAYLGDAEIGERANIGAGTIFCNYDGYSKHKTVIGADVFIGSDAHLVAPVTVGKNAFVATGTTVTEDVPEDAFAIGRSVLTIKPGYAIRLRARLLAKKKSLSPR